MENQYFNRQMEHEILEMAKSYPVITLTGPRQSGKTTLARHLFPEKKYYTLESGDIRTIALSDPRGFLDNYDQGMIIDEIQRAPQILSYIQEYVDENPNKKGQFILTCSHQLELQASITQSLAGRTALLSLLPFSLEEIKEVDVNFDLDQLLLHGGLPRIYKNGLNPTKAYRNYLHTYVERDVQKMINIKDISLFEKMLKLCAGRIGQIINYQSLASDIGISYHTVENWLSILEASFIIFRLQPYYENFGKRLIKSPKLYFTDVGFAAYLLGIENEVQMYRDPLRGGLFENLVILELMKTRLNQGFEPQLYFYRDNHGNEVDVIYKSANILIPIEIKAAQTFNNEFLKGIKYLKTLVGEKANYGFLIYAGSLEKTIDDTILLNYQNTGEVIVRSTVV